MALRHGQGQRKKYLTRELSRGSNHVEDMCAIVSALQSAKIGVHAISLRCGSYRLLSQRRNVWV